jgi:hypothetical protein
MVLCNIILALALKDALVDQLVLELGADEFERREQAALALEKLDLLAYPQLRNAAKSDDLEIRRRARELVDCIQPKILARAAAQRHVVVKASEGPVSYFGTVLHADGKHALILTTTSLVACCKPEALVEWGGKTYRASVEAKAEDADLALLSIKCERKLSPFPLASGRTKGVWCHHKFDMSGTFRFEPRYMGPRPGNTGGGSEDECGAGVFTLEESTGRLMLAGVNIGPLPGHQIVVDAKSPRGRVVASNCGVEPVRRLLDQWAEKTKTPYPDGK